MFKRMEVNFSIYKIWLKAIKLKTFLVTYFTVSNTHGRIIIILNLIEYENVFNKKHRY